MTASKGPDATKTEMTSKQDTTSTNAIAMPPQLASAANLFAHPMAGLAAAGAVGIGIAGQAFGMWIGAVFGAAEAAQKFYARAEDLPQSVRTAGPTKLKLVSSKTDVASVTPVSASKVKPNVRRKTVSQPIQGLDVAGPRKPASIQRPAAPDDLKAITGVGPKLEAVLNGLGIWTWRQIATLDAAEVAWLDDHLGFAGRIGRDDWAGQAKTLAGDARVN